MNTNLVKLSASEAEAASLHLVAPGKERFAGAAMKGGVMAVTTKAPKPVVYTQFQIACQEIFIAMGYEAFDFRPFRSHVLSSDVVKRFASSDNVSTPSEKQWSHILAARDRFAPGIRFDFEIEAENEHANEVA